MIDIFEDTTENLELERFKVKLVEIWNRILEETYSEDMGPKEEYMACNALQFANDPQPESEIDNLMAMLEEMLDPQEELESVKSEGKAPTYKGSQLKANNDGRKVESTSYEFEFTSTKTPSDSKTGVKSGTYKEPTTGKIASRKDARVIRSFSPMAEMMRDELVALKQRRAAGVREFRQRV